MAGLHSRQNIKSLLGLWITSVFYLVIQILSISGKLQILSKSLLAVQNMKKAIILLLLIITNTFAESDVIENSMLCESITTVVGHSPKNVIEKLGKPLSSNEKPINNLYRPDAKDKEVLLKYNDGYVMFRYISYSDKYFLLVAKLNKNSFNNTIREIIPNKINSFINKHGKPDKTTNTEYRYFCTFEGNEWVEIYHNESIVTGFKFHGYLD